MGISQENENCQGQSNCQQTSPLRPQVFDSLNNSGCQFPKSARILSGKHFQAILREKNRFIGSCIYIDYRQGKSLCPRLGITVSKKFGKAHDRNRFKRLVRETFRTLFHQFPQHLELNVSPRMMPLKNISKNTILEDISLLISKIELLACRI